MCTLPIEDNYFGLAYFRLFQFSLFALTRRATCIQIRLFAKILQKRMIFLYKGCFKRYFWSQSDCCEGEGMNEWLNVLLLLLFQVGHSNFKMATNILMIASLFLVAQ